MLVQCVFAAHGISIPVHTDGVSSNFSAFVRMLHMSIMDAPSILCAPLQRTGVACWQHEGGGLGAGVAVCTGEVYRCCDSHKVVMRD